METSPEKKSLVAKLAEACDAVGGVEKKGRNKDQGYDYLKAADVAKAIRHELFSRGVMILPHEIECLNEKFQTNGGKTASEVKLTIVYKVTDGAETLDFTAYGIARDFSDKAVYKAKTGALKYFLRGLGLIPDEKDDPEHGESIENAKAEESMEEFDQRTADQIRVKPFQVNAFVKTCADNGKTIEQMESYLKTRFKVVQVEELTKADFNEAIKWAAKNGDPANLESTLEMSKLDALDKKARKPAPVSGKQVSFNPGEFDDFKIERKRLE